MDFKSCYTDCCVACNSLGPNFRTSSKIQGQGDCKDSITFQEHQIDWEKRKTLGKKFREENRFEHKKQLNTYCDCFSKNNKNEDCNIRHEAKYEKKNIEFFQNCTGPWNSSYANWTNHEIKKSSVFEDLKNKHSNSDKFVAETISELKDKVEFLLKNFKNYNPKLFSDSYHEISHGDCIGIMPKDVYHLFNINNRLSIAEKNIERLTVILEDLLSDSDKRKNFFSNKNPIFSEQLNFEDMPITQRINLLKSRNDFLFDFMKNFLQVSSVEELYSMLDSVPRDYESNQNSQNSTYCYVEQNKSNNYSQENVMETSRELKRQVSKGGNEISSNCNENYSTRHGRKGENATKCFRNKLEVISEQAELAFYYDSEYKNSSEYKKKSNEYLRGNMEDKQENPEKDPGISEKTAKLLAEEAMLKSSLDKADFEAFSHRDTSERNFSPGKKNSPNLSTESTTERETETSLDSARSAFWENQRTKKSKINDPRKCLNHRDCKKEIKQERNIDPKKSTVSTKKINKLSDFRNSSCKLLSQKSQTLVSMRPKGNSYYLPEICSFSREEPKKEIKIKNQRPMSTPGSLGKTSQTSGIAALVSEKTRKKISGITNVRNKNKILLSQKSCVQTA